MTWEVLQGEVQGKNGLKKYSYMKFSKYNSLINVKKGGIVYLEEIGH